MKFTEKLKKMDACSNAVEWCENYQSLQKAWDACERPDWSLWLVGKLSGDPNNKKRKKLVLCACDCARQALKFLPETEKRPLIAIETAEKWANGDNFISLQDIRNAADATYAAYAADSAYAAAFAAYAAAFAAFTADSADATYAAYAAAYAADSADAAAKKEMQIKCADIVRKHYPKAPKI